MRLAAILLWSLARPAFGQTCLASATGESFGTYNPFSPTATTSTATLTVTCQSTVPVMASYVIALGGGGSRSMGSGAAGLAYQLYRDAARTQVWGDGTGGSATVADGYVLSALTPVIRTYTAYGVIAPGIRVAPGVYGDTVTVLLTY